METQTYEPVKEFAEKAENFVYRMRDLKERVYQAVVNSNKVGTQRALFELYKHSPEATELSEPGTNHWNIDALRNLPIRVSAMLRQGIPNELEQRLIAVSGEASFVAKEVEKFEEAANKKVA
ncbi:hypothetical protein HYW74_02075 [Candidatus Pacearchaeota archaeon]|nr:hypothetical protein [Candidatus Pacearchaeota archaeon]